MSDGNWRIFVQRPVAAVLLAIGVTLLAAAAAGYYSRRKDWRARLAEAEAADKR